MLCLGTMPGLLHLQWHSVLVFLAILLCVLQEYSVDFQGHAEGEGDAESCHRFCGKTEDCQWWSWEPAQSLCIAFANCTESGPPDAGVCPDCISGQRL